MKPLIAALTLAAIAACSPTVQTTSGTAFLADRATPVDKDIRQAAAGEPDLTFPARIGIARVNSRALMDMSGAEIDTLSNIKIDEARIGQIAPVNAFASSQSGKGGIRDARLHGAEQHFDYILVYKMTQDGRGFQAKGRADIAFVDVRNGYVYGRTFVEESLAGLGVRRQDWNEFTPSDDGAAKLMNASLPDVADMLTMLLEQSRQP